MCLGAETCGIDVTPRTLAPFESEMHGMVPAPDMLDIGKDECTGTANAPFSAAILEMASQWRQLAPETEQTSQRILLRQHLCKADAFNMLKSLWRTFDFVDAAQQFMGYALRLELAGCLTATAHAGGADWTWGMMTP